MASRPLDFGIRNVIDPTRGAQTALSNVGDILKTRENLKQQDIVNQRAAAQLALQQAQEGRAATTFEDQQKELARKLQQREAVNTAINAPDILGAGTTSAINEAYARLNKQYESGAVDGYDEKLAQLNQAVSGNLEQRLKSPLMTSAQRGDLARQQMVQSGVDAPTAIDMAAKYQASIAPAAVDTKTATDAAKTILAAEVSTKNANAKNSANLRKASYKSGVTGKEYKVTPHALVGPLTEEYAKSDFWSGNEDVALKAAQGLSMAGYSDEEQSQILRNANPAEDNFFAPVYNADSTEFDKLKGFVDPAVLASVDEFSHGRITSREHEDNLRKIYTNRKDTDGSGSSRSVAVTGAENADITPELNRYRQTIAKAYAPNEIDKRTGKSASELGFGKTAKEIDAIIGDRVAAITNKPASAPKPSGKTAPITAFDKDTGIGAAMNSPQEGMLLKYAESSKADFLKEYEALTKPEQNRVDKVLGSTISEAVNVPPVPVVPATVPGAPVSRIPAPAPVIASPSNRGGKRNISDLNVFDTTYAAPVGGRSAGGRNVGITKQSTPIGPTPAQLQAIQSQLAVKFPNATSTELAAMMQQLQQPTNRFGNVPPVSTAVRPTLSRGL